MVSLPLVAPAVSAAQQREPFPGLDSYVRSALEQWKVPGAAIAIVRNDSVIYARGYGVRDVGTSAPVTAQTIFAVGSLSKAFTATAAAMLVDEGRLSLDAPVTTYLPEFRLADPATRDVTLRDLLSHRTGTARSELAWYGSRADRAELVRRAQYLPAAAPFRSTFIYNNIMYLAAGQVVGRVADTSWDEVVRTRIFTPLGMTSTGTTVRELSHQADVATPHAAVATGVITIPWRNADNIGPAGSINSNVVDMAQWVRLQLGAGAYGGRQLVSRRLSDEMHSPQTIIPLQGLAKRFEPLAHLAAYGMGWVLNDHGGRLVVKHTGGIDGMSSLVALVPEERFGFVVLTNLDGTFLPSALALRLIDLQLGRAARDWSKELRNVVDSVESAMRDAQADADSRRLIGTRPSLPLSAYTATYADSAYGQLTVREEGGKLHFAFGPSWHGELEHWHLDTFRARLTTPSLPFVTLHFRLDPTGGVSDVQMDAASGGSATFRRVREARHAITRSGNWKSPRPGHAVSGPPQ
jgi:CubicO group peptidase (beta-lactamase class C family)